MENALLSPTQPVKHGKNRLKRPKFGTVCSSALWHFWKMGFKWFTLIHFGKVKHSMEKRRLTRKKKQGQKKHKKLLPPGIEPSTSILQAQHPIHYTIFAIKYKCGQKIVEPKFCALGSGKHQRLRKFSLCRRQNLKPNKGGLSHFFRGGFKLLFPKPVKTVKFRGTC